MPSLDVLQMKVKAFQIPDNTTWLSIFLAVLFQLLIIALLLPPSAEPVVNWVALSTFTLLGGITFLAVYEKAKGNQRRAYVITILNATLVFWWVPLALVIWMVVE